MPSIAKVVFVACLVGAQAAFDCPLYKSTCEGLSDYEAYSDCTSTASLNNMTCRIKHLELAAVAGGAATHCPHAAPTTSTNQSIPCASEILEVFDCDLYATTCSGVAGYEAYPSCKTGTILMNDANDMACRIKHLELAKSAAATHCPHAAPNAAAAAPCAAEMLKKFDCDLYETTCSGVAGYQAYTNCASTMAVNTAAGMACRTYHLSLAAMSGGAETHCAHAQFGATVPCAAETLKAFDCAVYASTCSNVTTYVAYSDCAATVAANPGGMQCRIQHLQLAAADADKHCIHAAEQVSDACTSELLVSNTTMPTTGGGAMVSFAAMPGLSGLCLFALLNAMLA